MRHFLFLAALGALLPTIPAARAAESLDTCTGIIASVPTVITTQGTWCLDHDLATSATGAIAIDVKTNNVTIDCNGFKLGNLAAGVSTASIGIVALERSNITVRGCAIRGFQQAIHLGNETGGGHLVEDNRIDGATVVGIYAVGDGGSIVRRNIVTDIGSSLWSNFVYGIYVDGDALDNVVERVSSTYENSFAAGIYVNSPEVVGLLVAGNRVRDVYGKGTGAAMGVWAQATGGVVRDNVVVNAGSTPGTAIGCVGDGVISGNVVGNYSQDFNSCTDGGGNVAF